MARESGSEPRYAQVATELRAAINAGEYAKGDAVPTESVLCAHYGVSRFTVREALRRLQAEGLIRRRRGSGTVVASPEQVMRQPLSDISEILQYAAESQFLFQDCGPTTLTATKAEAFGVDEGSLWMHLSGLRRVSAGGPPIASTNVYINPELKGHISALRPSPQTIFEQLAKSAGFRVTRIIQTITAAAAGNYEASALEVSRRAPVLRIIRSYRDENDRIVVISDSTHPGERFTYTTHIDH
jgi:DNA-binding GntR family transcriptional regulator